MIITEITFQKTGNFWIDNGIVGLYRVYHPTGTLQEIQDENQQIIKYEVLLEADKLTIQLLDARIIEEERSEDLLKIFKTPPLLFRIIEEERSEDDKKSKKKKSDKIHPDLLLVLNWARNRLPVEYLSISEKNYRWFYNEEAQTFEIFRKSSYKAHLRKVFFNAKPYYQGTIDFKKGKLSYIGKELKDKNRDIDDAERQLFETFKKQNEEVFKNNISSAEREVGFINQPSIYTFGKEVEDNFIQKGAKLCDFSYEMFAITNEINGMYYPFLTSSSGELNFSSLLGKKPNISLKYAFIATFAFYNLHYILHQKDKKTQIGNYFLLYESNLKKLNSFYNKIVVNPTQLKNATYCNFQNDIIGTQYEFETLFAFIISIYNQLSGKMNKEERKGIYNKSIFTFTNDGNIFRDVKEYSSLEAFFKLLDAFSNAGQLNILNNLIKFFQKKVKDGYDTTWRNRICKDLLNFQSIALTLEKFLSEVRMKDEKGQGIPNLNQIIEIYYNTLTHLNMDNNMVDMCKRVGNSIGRYCRETDDKGILFSIRNSRNRIDFLKVLSDSQFRTEVLYSEEFFDKLPDTPQWEEYKALVSIFAMNSYLMKNKKENQSSNN